VVRPALDPLYNPKNRRETIDYDYLNKLSEEELDWLNKFTEEYNGASFKNDERDIHQDKEQKREIYGRNNARNRCLYTFVRSNGLVLDDDRPENDIEFTDHEYMEDALIDYIDSLEESEELVEGQNAGDNGSNPHSRTLKPGKS